LEENVIYVFDSFPFDENLSLIERDVCEILSFFQYIANTHDIQFKADSTTVEFVSVLKQGYDSNDCAFHTVINMARTAMSKDLKFSDSKLNLNSRRTRQHFVEYLKFSCRVLTTVTPISLFTIPPKVFMTDIVETYPTPAPSIAKYKLRNKFVLVKPDIHTEKKYLDAFQTIVRYSIKEETFLESSQNNQSSSSSSGQSSQNNQSSSSSSGQSKNRIICIGNSPRPKFQLLNILQRYEGYEKFVKISKKPEMLLTMVQCIFDCVNHKLDWKTYLVNLIDHSPTSPSLTLQLDVTMPYIVLIPVYVNKSQMSTSSVLVLYSYRSDEEKIFCVGNTLHVDQIKNLLRNIADCEKWGDILDNSESLQSTVNLSISRDKDGFASIFFLLNIFFGVNRTSFESYGEFESQLRMSCSQLTLSTPSIPMQIVYKKFRTATSQ
jgi:hypothetical protein